MRRPINLLYSPYSDMGVNKFHSNFVAAIAAQSHDMAWEVNVYKLLIIDDDHMIRNGIKNAICWQEHGIYAVETAENGEEGQEVFRTFMPDIILTDIRMPGMDGLELLKTVRESNPDVKVIILSGYDDFSYARTALKYGAFDYLLKTANIEELQNVIIKAKQSIDSDREKKNLYLKLRQQLNMSLPLLKYRYLNELIYGCTTPENVLKKLEFIDIKFKNMTYILSVSAIDNYAKLSEQVSEEELLLYKLGIINIMEEVISEVGICFETRNEEFVFIYFHDSDLSNEENMKTFLTRSEKVIDTVFNIFEINLSTGIGSTSDSLSDIKKCFLEAKKALDHKLFTGVGSIVHIDDISNFLNINFQLDTEYENKLLSALRVGEKKTVLLTLNGIFQQLQAQKNTHIINFTKICIELLGMASRVLSEFDSGMEEVLGTEILYFEEIRKYRNFEQARNWILSVFEKVCSYILNTKILRARKIVETAKSYIDEHFNENISLIKISELVHMSPNYFSSLFSNEMGQSLMEYVANRRMEKAKQLLGQKDSKASEVGDRVGYDNPYYFSRIFKKYTGMSPIEYKESMR